MIMFDKLKEKVLKFLPWFSHSHLSVLLHIELNFRLLQRANISIFLLQCYVQTRLLRQRTRWVPRSQQIVNWRHSGLGPKTILPRRKPFGIWTFHFRFRLVYNSYQRCRYGSRHAWETGKGQIFINWMDQRWQRWLFS